MFVSLFKTVSIQPRQFISFIYTQFLKCRNKMQRINSVTVSQCLYTLNLERKHFKNQRTKHKCLKSCIKSKEVQILKDEKLQLKQTLPAGRL